MIWKVSELAEISKIGDGAHASLRRVESGIPYLTAKNITKFGVNYSSMDYISENTYNKHFKEKSNALTQPKKDDILYSIIGSIGGVYLVRNERIGISSSVAIFRANNEIIISQYLAYFLKSSLFDTQVQAIKGGVAQGFMSLGKLGTVKILYPDNIDYQKKIVSILSTYDNFIENNQKQIKLLEEAAQRLYKEWFVDLRFPGYENVPVVDGVPEGWMQGTLGNIAKFRRGKTITKKQTIKGSIPVVAGGKEPAYYHNKSNTYEPVITVSASGNAGFTRMYYQKIWASDCSFLDINSTNNLYYVYTFLKYKQEDIYAMQKGACQQHVNAKEINNMELLIPTDDILSVFIQVISSYFEKIKALQKQIEISAQARDRLLPKLMSGEMEV